VVKVTFKANTRVVYLLRQFDDGTVGVHFSAVVEVTSPPSKITRLTLWLIQLPTEWVLTAVSQQVK
jgi:hypothetical protein